MLGGFGSAAPASRGGQIEDLSAGRTVLRLTVPATEKVMVVGVGPLALASSVARMMVGLTVAGFICDWRQPEVSG